MDTTKVILLKSRPDGKPKQSGFKFIEEDVPSISDGELLDYSGAKPMNINWRLEEPLPPYLWKDSAKLAI